MLLMSEMLRGEVLILGWRVSIWFEEILQRFDDGEVGLIPPAKDF